MALTLKRMIAAGRFTLNLMHSILFVIFLVLAAMMLAAYLGAGGMGVVGAGLVALAGGVATSKRIWFQPDAPAEEGIPNWRCPNCRGDLGRALPVKQCPHCGIVVLHD